MRILVLSDTHGDFNRMMKAVNQQPTAEVIIHCGDGEEQVLPQKEFQLLYKLLSYPGRIFTRIELMDEIWGADSDTGWETVTVHIGRLRKRFEGWAEFEIVSVRGLGYKAVKHE